MDESIGSLFSILGKIFSCKNEHLQKLIKDNKKLEIFNKVIGEEVNIIFEQKLLLSDNDYQFNPNEQEDTEAKKPTVIFGSKNFMQLLEEDNKIYKLFLEGGDYEKAFNEKKEKERLEQEEMKKKENEENKKEEEDAYFNNEEEEQDDNKKNDLKGSFNAFDQDDGEENKEKNNENENNENNNENENENEGEKENKEENKEKAEEIEEVKDFNDVNYWKPKITPDDNIMSAVLSDLD